MPAPQSVHWEEESSLPTLYPVSRPEASEVFNKARVRLPARIPRSWSFGKNRREEEEEEEEEGKCNYSLILWAPQRQTRHLSDISLAPRSPDNSGPSRFCGPAPRTELLWAPSRVQGLGGKGACLAGRARVRAVSSTLPPAVFLEMGLGLAQRRLLSTTPRLPPCLPPTWPGPVSLESRSSWRKIPLPTPTAKSLPDSPRTHP
jgi:hypothetical protein